MLPSRIGSQIAYQCREFAAKEKRSAKKDLLHSLKSLKLSAETSQLVLGVVEFALEQLGSKTVSSGTSATSLEEDDFSRYWAASVLGSAGGIPFDPVADSRHTHSEAERRPAYENRYKAWRSVSSFIKHYRAIALESSRDQLPLQNELGKKLREHANPDNAKWVAGVIVREIALLRVGSLGEVASTRPAPRESAGRLVSVRARVDGRLASLFTCDALGKALRASDSASLIHSIYDASISAMLMCVQPASDGRRTVGSSAPRTHLQVHLPPLGSLAGAVELCKGIAEFLGVIGNGTSTIRAHMSSLRLQLDRGRAEPPAAAGAGAAGADSTGAENARRELVHAVVEDALALEDAIALVTREQASASHGDQRQAGAPPQLRASSPSAARHVGALELRRGKTLLAVAADIIRESAIPGSVRSGPLCAERVGRHFPRVADPHQDQVAVELSQACEALLAPSRSKSSSAPPSAFGQEADPGNDLLREADPAQGAAPSSFVHPSQQQSRGAGPADSPSKRKIAPTLIPRGSEDVEGLGYELRAECSQSASGTAAPDHGPIAGDRGSGLDALEGARFARDLRESFLLRAPRTAGLVLAVSTIVSVDDIVLDPRAVQMCESVAANAVAAFKAGARDRQSNGPVPHSSAGDLGTGSATVRIEMEESWGALSAAAVSEARKRAMQVLVQTRHDSQADGRAGKQAGIDVSPLAEGVAAAAAVQAGPTARHARLGAVGAASRVAAAAAIRATRQVAQSAATRLVGLSLQRQKQASFRDALGLLRASGGQRPARLPL